MIARPWRTFAIASTAVSLVSLDATVLYAAFPALREAFAQASPADLSWVSRRGRARRRRARVADRL